MVFFLLYLQLFFFSWEKGAKMAKNEGDESWCCYDRWFLRSFLVVFNIFFFLAPIWLKSFLSFLNGNLFFSSSHVFFQIYNLFFLIWRHPIFFCPFRQLGLEFPFWTLKRRFEFVICWYHANSWNSNFWFIQYFLFV